MVVFVKKVGFFSKSDLKNPQNSSILCTIQALIAQLVEQVTLNHWVLGSSPRERTIKITAVPFGMAFFLDGFFFGWLFWGWF